MQLTIDRFGRVVLPKGLRDGLGLTPGAVLEVDGQAECIVLRPVREADAARMKDGLLVASGRPTGDLRGAVAAHRRARLHGLSGLRGGP